MKTKLISFSVDSARLAELPTVKYLWQRYTLPISKDGSKDEWLDRLIDGVRLLGVAQGRMKLRWAIESDAFDETMRALSSAERDAPPRGLTELFIARIKAKELWTDPDLQRQAAAIEALSLFGQKDDPVVRAVMLRSKIGCRSTGDEAILLSQVAAYYSRTGDLESFINLPVSSLTDELFRTRALFDRYQDIESLREFWRAVPLASRKSPSYQIAMSRAFARLGEKKEAEYLFNLLLDNMDDGEDDKVFLDGEELRSEAARAIMAIHCRTNDTEEIRRLVRLIFNSPKGYKQIGNAAIEALGEVGSDEDIKLLKAACREKDKDVSRAAARAIANILVREGRTQEIFKLVRREMLIGVMHGSFSLSWENTRYHIFLRIAAIEALGRVGGKKDLKKLVKLSKSGNVYISKAAMKAIVGIARRTLDSDSLRIASELRGLYLGMGEEPKKLHVETIVGLMVKGQDLAGLMARIEAVALFENNLDENKMMIEDKAVEKAIMTFQVGEIEIDLRKNYAETSGAAVEALGREAAYGLVTLFAGQGQLAERLDELLDLRFGIEAVTRYLTEKKLGTGDEG